MAEGLSVAGLAVGLATAGLVGVGLVTAGLQWLVSGGKFGGIR